MNSYIYNKSNKESMYHMLKDIDSPIAELYKGSYPKGNEISNFLSTFLSSQVMKNYVIADNMKLLEAQALLNWIYKTFRTTDERLEATTELAELLKEKYKLEGEIRVAQGIAYLSSQVELNFISSINEFCYMIEDIHKLGKSIFYRGHSEANYILIPSLMRRQSWLQNERKMYNEILIKSPESFREMKHHLDYLVEMQHYGLPTRLLDITTNPLVALYFACEYHPNLFGEIVVFSVEDCDIKYHKSDTVSILASLPMFEYEKQQEIYRYATDKLLSTEEFNEKVHHLLHEIRSEKPEFKDEILQEDLLRNLVVLPVKNNNRILKQDGAFIICGLSEDYKHLDINKLRYEGSNGKKQIFLINNKQKLLDLLNAFSINKAALFPEIDDVADYIRSKY
ncbi:FRG domain-containing protein [Clostridium sp. WILCCON 0185]|uniref:FRG domain-containing protein n=2 Tax=Candidatus Clostridium stratigraminis TaxID=3381661 RepID=A0ABW8T8W0_9CLOT